MVSVLVACEWSGRVRDALRSRGVDAWSCDKRQSLTRTPYHVRGDVREVLSARWDAIIAFPPCTYLARSGARWWPDHQDEQAEAIRFVRDLWDAPTPRMAIENPIGILSTAWRKPDQIIHPWQFGHGETKATCLWLRGLPPLEPTNVVDGRRPRVHHLPPGPRRSRERSITYQGIADAMADQWSGSVPGLSSDAATDPLASSTLLRSAALFTAPLGPE